MGLFFLRWLGLWIVLTCLAAASASAEVPLLSAQERAWLAQHPEVRISISPDYPPFSYLDEKGLPAGAVADYLALVQQRTGIRLKTIVPTPAQRAINDPKLKGVDAIAIFAETPERQKYWRFTQAYLDFPLYLIARDDAPRNLTLDTLGKLPLAVVGQYAVTEFLAADYPKLQLSLVPDTRAGLQQVAFGEASAFISDLPVASWWLQKEGLGNLRVAGRTGYHYRMGMAVRSDWPELHSILEKGLATITAQEREHITQRWSQGPLLDQTPLERWRLWIAVGALGLLAVLVFSLYFWDRALQKMVVARISSTQQGAPRKASPRTLMHRLVFPVSLGLVTVLVLLGLLLVGAQQWYQEQEEGVLATLADDHRRLLQALMDNETDILQAATHAFSIQERIDESEFARFAADLMRLYPIIHSVQWRPCIESNGRQAFERVVRAQGVTDYAIWENASGGEKIPAAKRARYCPVRYVQPQHGNQGWLGHDFGEADVIVRHKINNAIHTHKPVIVSEWGGDNDAGPEVMQTLIPVQRIEEGGARNPDPEAVMGFVVVSVSVTGLLDEALHGTNLGGLSLLVLSEAGAGKRIELLRHMHDTKLQRSAVDDLLKQSRLQWHAELRLADERLEAVYLADDGYRALSRPWQLWALVSTLMLVFALVGGYQWASLRRTRQIEGLVDELVGQIDRRERSDRTLRSSEERLQRQNATLMQLASSQLADWQEPAQVFKELCALTASTLGVARTSVWLFDPDGQTLRCMNLYTLNRNTHESGATLKSGEYPEYFAALGRDRVIAANDASIHPATHEFAQGYLATNNIGAMLDSTLRMNGKVIGVVCNEHVGGTRQWTLDEQNFAGSIADMTRLAIEIHQREMAEQELMRHRDHLEDLVEARTQALSESEQRFRFVVQRAPLAIVCLSTGGEIVEFNPEAERATGYTREQVIGQHFQDFLVAESSRAMASEIISRMEAGTRYRGQELSIACADGSTIDFAWYAGIEKDVDGRQIIVAIGQDITMQKAVEHAMMLAREAAESADRIKSMFVASMSHELRTPLNSIIGFLGVVLQGMSGEVNERQRDQLERAYRSARHLLALISDVIDISKIEAGYISTYMERFEVLPVLIEAKHAMQHMAQEKNLSVTIDCPEELTIESDRKRFYQAVLNLVSNAVKYTERGWVRIEVDAMAHGIELRVRDSGIGIAEADLNRLFQPFERMDTRLRIKILGTGLGLYLTRKIVTQLMGGDINVESTPEVGSTFTIRLPLVAPPTPAHTAVSEGALP